MSQCQSGLWDDWLQSSLAYLRDAQLLRTLRPTVWCNSSTEALIHRADLDAWLAGELPVVRHYDQCGALNGAAAAVGSPSSFHSEPVVRQYGTSSRSVGHGAGAAVASASCGSDVGGSGRRCACGDACGSNGASCNGHPCGDGASSAGTISACSGLPGSHPEDRCSTSSQAGGASGRGPTHGSDLVRLRLFSLNDYLGLASHPEVAEATARAASQVGLGPRSSALVAGYTHSHRQLEEGLAQLKGTEDALLFPTGFAANLALMTSLAFAAQQASGAAAAGGGGDGSGPAGAGAGSGVAIFSDELNHASIIDGARLASRGAAGSGAAARLHIYRHNDLSHLEELLAATPAGVRRLVVTDSLFSMDGDFADLRGLVALKRRHPFLLAVDEAHATLVCGEAGGGAAEALGVADEVDLHVGTLSKAFGCLGGFIGCSSAMKQLLLNRGRAFVYSTSLPVPVVEAAAAALRVSQRESWRRAHVWSLVRRLGEGLGVPALSPVVPLVVGPEGPTLELSSRLLAAGLHVPAIRPPTVPPGTCRLRVSLSAAHTYDDVDELIRLVRQSAVPLVRLPHLLDDRAALPGLGSVAGGGAGAPPPPPLQHAGLPRSRM